MNGSRDRHTPTDAYTTTVGPQGRTLEQITADARDVRGVWAKDVAAGDWVVVETRNSVYSLAANGDGTFVVAGGWFAANGAGSRPVRVIGCTWGGLAILTGLVAAPGMFLEFDNGVRTTRVRHVRVFRGHAGAGPL